jgi:hypothetical protein
VRDTRNLLLLLTTSLVISLNAPLQHFARTSSDPGRRKVRASLSIKS